jgi:hypothetical protein
MVARDAESREAASRRLQGEAAVRLTQSEDPRERERGQLILKQLELEKDVRDLKKAAVVGSLPEIARSVIHAEIQRLDHESNELRARLSLLRGPSRIDSIVQAMKEILTPEQREAVTARAREIRGVKDRDEEPANEKEEEPVKADAPAARPRAGHREAAAYADYKASRLAR